MKITKEKATQKRKGSKAKKEPDVQPSVPVTELELIRSIRKGDLQADYVEQCHAVIAAIKDIETKEYITEAEAAKLKLLTGLREGLRRMFDTAKKYDVLEGLLKPEKSELESTIAEHIKHIGTGLE